MPIRHAVRRALRACPRSLPVGIATAAMSGPLLLLSGPAWSQASSPDDQAEEVREVVVVGSRIRRDTFNSPSPIQVVTREETTLGGFIGMTDALQGTGITNGAGQINEAFGGFVTNGGPGANTLSLRNLGAGRTLVLINGRRVAPAGTRGAVGSADLNVLPTAIVDRIEVLRDGASSVYGSDAVAGVVNVVTRKDVRGITFEAALYQPTESGGEQGRLSLVGGAAGDRWEVRGSFDYYNRSVLKLADRDWARCQQDRLVDRATGQSLDFIDPRTGESKCYTITGAGSNGVTINTIGTQNITAANFASLGLSAPPVGAPGSSGTSFNRFRPNASVTTGLVGYEGVGGGTNSLNVRDTFEERMLDEDLLSPARTYTAFAEGSYHLGTLGDSSLYFELIATRRDTWQANYRQMTLDYRRGSPLIPPELAFSTFSPDQGTSGGEPVGVRAFIGFGTDHSEQTVDYYRPTLGIQGNLPFGRDWRYNLSASYSKSNGEYTQQAFLIDKLTFAGDVVAAPASVDPELVKNGLTCRINLTDTAERCIPYPELNAATVGGDLPPDFVSYVFRDVTGETAYDETLVNATFDGPLFDLPAGTVQAVIGFEHRREELDDAPSPESVAGNLLNFTSSLPTRGTDRVSELFTEIEVPLLADLPAAHRLTFNGSFRYTDYESYGSDTTYKAGLMYSPLSWLTVRGSRGTSFRAPALFEQYQGATSGFFASSNDPCNDYGQRDPVRAANCAKELPGQPDFLATTGIQSLSQGGAEAGLFAETSKNTSVGVILQPPIAGLGNLSIAVDYFDIRIENGVDQPGALNILQRCYDDPDFRDGGGFCRLVTRLPVSNQLVVSNAYTNIATQISKGFDYTLRWERAVSRGTLRLNTHLTRYTTQADKLFADEELDENNGTLNSPKWSGTADLSYQVGGWRVLYGVDWLGSMNSYELRGVDPQTTPFDYDVPDYVRHRLSVRYTHQPLRMQVTLGVQNLLDEEPPQISQGFYNRVGNAPLYSGYDYLGRRVFLSVMKEF